MLHANLEAGGSFVRIQYPCPESSKRGNPNQEIGKIFQLIVKLLPNKGVISFQRIPERRIFANSAGYATDPSLKCASKRMIRHKVLDIAPEIS